MEDFILRTITPLFLGFIIIVATILLSAITYMAVKDIIKNNKNN